MNDPITDMFNRIKNAQAVLKETVEFPFSNLKYEIANILEKNSFIKKVEKKGKKTKKIIELTLKYLPAEALAKEGDGKTPAISGIKRISKPGQRIYLSHRQIKRVRGGYGIAIISTSKNGEGLMTDKEARKQKVGGEVICEIW